MWQKECVTLKFHYVAKNFYFTANVGRNFGRCLLVLDVMEHCAWYVLEILGDIDILCDGYGIGFK